MEGKAAKDNRLHVSIDWSKAPQGTVEGNVEIVCGKSKAEVKVTIVNTALPHSKETFFGTLAHSEFSIPAHAYNANISGKQAAWVFIPDLGRGKGCMGSCTSTTDRPGPSGVSRAGRQCRPSASVRPSANACITHLTRNQFTVYAVRGFESHHLRQ